MTPSHQQDDFYSMGTGLKTLKAIAGLAQLIVGIGVFFLNRYYIQEQLVGLAGIAMAGVGLYLLGVRSQTLISPARKEMIITRGFFFITTTQRYYRRDINAIQVKLKTHRGTDSNGIGPTQEDTLIFTYYVQLLLKNNLVKTILSGRDKNEMEAFAGKVATAMDVNLQVTD